jgi:hypothetical protein
MAPLHIFVWDNPLILSIPLGGISIHMVNILSNSKFDCEGNVYAFMHLNQFHITRKNLRLFRKMKSLDCLSSYLKGGLKPILEHFQ